MGMLLLNGSTDLNPRELFASGEQGMWLDPSDFSTMWQDSAKTTPVTAAGNPVGYISDKSGRGNDAFQTTSASRPTLARIPSSGRRNLLTNTEEFDNAAWQKVKTGTASIPVITPNTAVAPDGTVTADTAVFDLNSGSDISQLQQASTITSQQYTWSFYAKTTDGTSKAFQIAGPVGSGSDITITGDWQRFSQTGTGSGTCRVRLNGAASTAIAASIYIWGAQLETGSTATNYQKVVATTDVTESGVSDLWHLVFDGSDDSLTTNSVDMTGTAQMTVIAGVRKLSDAASGMVAELSATASSNNGSFNFLAPRANGEASYAFTVNGGGSLNLRSYTGLSAPRTDVVSALLEATAANSAAAVSTRLNGVALTGTDVVSSSASGNFGNYVLNIGRRNQASIPYNGHLYQLIIRGRTTPTGKLLEAERFVGRKTGVSF